MPPARKRPAPPPPATDAEMRDIRDMLDSLNKTQGEMNKKQEEVMKKQGEMAEMIKELHRQTKEPKKGSYIEKFPIKKKTFTMVHTLRNVSKILDGDTAASEKQYFYGFDWQVWLLQKEDGSIGCFLHCSNAELPNQWMIRTQYTIIRQVDLEKNICECQKTFTSENAAYGYGTAKFMKREEIMSAVNDEVVVEVEMTILKMEGIWKPRKFDERHREFSDMVLTVDGEDFYVLKKFLAFRSSFFNRMFHSNYEEANKDHIELTGVDPGDFQSFLEAVYGEATIEDSNVEGILDLADYFISPYALKECEKFLLRDSKMTPEKKYQLSKQYTLEKLMEKCISEMEDIDFIEAEVENTETSRCTLQKLAARLLVLLKANCP